MISRHPTSAQVLRPRFASIPEKLRDMPNWVLWNHEERDGKLTKVPYQPSGVRASSTDHRTWSSYAEICDAFAFPAQQTSGIGIVIHPDTQIIAIDLDKCRDPDTGHVDPWAAGIVRRLESYTEVSPTGRGLHILGYGTKPGAKCRKGRVEVYDRDRYLTITGHVYDDLHHVNELDPEALAWLYEKHLAPKESGPTPTRPRQSLGLEDTKIIDIARKAKNSHTFNALWAGDTSAYGGDRSVADIALLGVLKFYTQSPNQLDRLFRASGLMRPKWDERRGAKTYGERTIDEALANMPKATYGDRRKSENRSFSTPKNSHVDTASVRGLGAQDLIARWLVGTAGPDSPRLTWRDKGRAYSERDSRLVGVQDVRYFGTEAVLAWLVENSAQCLAEEDDEKLHKAAHGAYNHWHGVAFHLVMRDLPEKGETDQVEKHEDLDFPSVIHSVLATTIRVSQTTEQIPVNTTILEEARKAQQPSWSQVGRYSVYVRGSKAGTDQPVIAMHYDAFVTIGGNKIKHATKSFARLLRQHGIASSGAVSVDGVKRRLYQIAPSWLTSFESRAHGDDFTTELNKLE